MGKRAGIDLAGFGAAGGCALGGDGGALTGGRGILGGILGGICSSFMV